MRLAAYMAGVGTLDQDPPGLMDASAVMLAPRLTVIVSSRSASASAGRSVASTRAQISRRSGYGCRPTRSRHGGDPPGHVATSSDTVNPECAHDSNTV